MTWLTNEELEEYELAGCTCADCLYQDDCSDSEICNDFIPTKSIEAKWICETCVNYPPSSCDGKPCCVCDPDDPLLNCYQRKEQEYDLDLFIECAKRYGAKVSKCEPGSGGVYVNGKKITAKELFNETELL